MQGGDPEMMKALESKLGALVRCVLKKAQSDPPFAEQLQEILLSDTLRAKIKGKKPLVEKSPFNPVTVLQAQGRDGLHRELEGKPTSELFGVARSLRIVKAKSAKAPERPALIEAIIAYSERSLNRGGAFLRNRRVEESVPPEGSTTEPSGRSGEGDLQEVNPQADHSTSPIEATLADAGEGLTAENFKGASE